MNSCYQRGTDLCCGARTWGNAKICISLGCGGCRCGIGNDSAPALFAGDAAKTTDAVVCQYGITPPLPMDGADTVLAVAERGSVGLAFDANFAPVATFSIIDQAGLGPILPVDRAWVGWLGDWRTGGGPFRSKDVPWERQRRLLIGRMMV